MLPASTEMRLVRHWHHMVANIHVRSVKVSEKTGFVMLAGCYLQKTAQYKVV